MRIVVAMIEPPLPFGNAAARWFYVLLRGLVAQGHQVTAFAACHNPADLAKARELFPAPQYDLRLYPYPERRGLLAKIETWRRPYSYMFSRELKHDLEAELARGYDVLHLEQLWAGWLGLRHRDRTLVNVHHLQAIDLEEAPTPTRRAAREHRLIASTEAYLVRQYTHFRSCSPRLIPRMQQWNPSARITTVPVGIDTKLYDYIPDEKRTEAPILGLIGSLGWYPTRSAAVRLLEKLGPAVQRRLPGTRIQIIGWNARSVLADYLNRPGVTILENVPDARPYFEQTGVLLYAPGRGSGMKIKILEALAYGVPVVTTSEGAEGLPAIDGLHMGLAEDDEGLIERAITLLSHPSRANQLRASGRHLVEEHCDPDATVSAIEAIYQGMRGEHSS